MPVNLSSINTILPATTSRVIFDGVSISSTTTINKTGLSIPAGTHIFQSSGYGTIQIGSYPAQSFYPNTPLYVYVPATQTTATVTLTKSAPFSTFTKNSIGTGNVSASLSFNNSSMYGNGSNFIGVYGNAGIAYSTDGGITWTKGSSTSLPGPVAYGNNRYLSMGYSSANSYYSTDGINWTSASKPSSDYAYRPIWNGSNFVAFSGYYQTTYMYTSDGITFNNNNYPNTTQGTTIGAACYGNGLIVAFGQENTTTTTYYGYYTSSTTGASLTRFTQPLGSSGCSAVAWNGSIFVMGSSSSSTYATSTNGTTWTTRSLGGGLTRLDGLYTGNGKFLAVDASNSSALKWASSTDGINWTSITSPYTSNSTYTSSVGGLPSGSSSPNFTSLGYYGGQFFFIAGTNNNDGLVTLNTTFIPTSFGLYQGPGTSY